MLCHIIILPSYLENILFKSKGGEAINQRLIAVFKRKLEGLCFLQNLQEHPGNHIPVFIENHYFHFKIEETSFFLKLVFVMVAFFFPVLL